MKEGLNLLPSVAKFQAARIKLKKTINFGVAVFLTCWVIFGITVFATLFVTKYSLSQAENNKTKALNKYKSLATNVVISKRNKYQAKLVGQVLKERFEYGTSIEKVTNLFSEDVSLNSVEIKGNKKFLIKGSFADGKKLNEIEEKVKSINSKEYPNFSSAKLTSVIVIFSGWSFEMEVSLI